MPIRKVKYDGEPSELVLALPHYGKVPKSPAKQREFRLNIRRRCDHPVEQKDVDFREKIRAACEVDPLFFINVFCYLMEPRNDVKNQLLQFNTWPHQDVVIAEIAAHWGQQNYVGDKSREQGASWIMAALFVWSFTFHDTIQLAFASKDDETADDPDDMGSFGAKIDFLLERLPDWLRPEFRRSTSRHTWKRSKGKTVIKKGAMIKAFSATKGVARGGRYTVFFVDEGAFFPAGADYEADHTLVHVTRSQIWWSTPNGMNNAFYDKIHGENDYVHLQLHFLDNPAHNEGRYTTTAGMLEVFDGEPVPGYPYELDGKIRTFWSDKYWLSHGKDSIFLSRELYIDYGGSKGRPFPKASLDRAELQCQNPIETGMLLYDFADPGCLRSHQWVRGAGHKFDLWRPVDAWGRMHVSRPVIGADISMGNSGDKSSNSVLSIWDAQNWEQVGELAINSLGPTEFARLAVAVCWWLSPRGQTFLVWEKNGPGIAFTDEIMLLGYSNVYMENTGGDTQKLNVQKSDKPGYHTVKMTRTLGPLVSAVVRQDAILRSRALVAECGEYEIDDKGRWIHPRSVNTRDSSAKGEGHGDRAVAAALAFHGMRERGPVSAAVTKKSSPRSLAGRVARQKEAERQLRRHFSRW